MDAITQVIKLRRGIGCPQDPIAEGGLVGFSDGGNRRDWFPGVLRAVYAPPKDEGRLGRLIFMWRKLRRAFSS